MLSETLKKAWRCCSFLIRPREKSQWSGRRRQRGGSNATLMVLVRRTTSLQVAGGVIWDAKGEWISSFRMNLCCLDLCSSEIWGILPDLDLAWKKEFRRIYMETDLRKAVTLVKNECSTNSPYADLVRKTIDMLNSEWEVILQSSYREKNKAANWLATAAHNQISGL